MPSEFGDLIATIRQRVKGIENVVISAHCHNDLGMAVANALAAVAAGARQVECTINGIGERAGNASLEEIVMAMRVRPDRYPYETGVVERTDFRRQPDVERDHGRARAAEQGDHWAQCLRARSGHSSGRHAEESADLRDHDAEVGGRAGFEAGAGQALRASRAWHCAANNWDTSSTGGRWTIFTGGLSGWRTRSSMWKIITCWN